MSLEDDFTDVISKALIGTGISEKELLEKASVSPSEFRDVMGGQMEVQVVRRLATALDLHADALAALPEYLPETVVVPGLRRIELPFRAWTVNAWLLEKEGTSLLFDTGWRENDIVSEISPEDIDCAIITHGHEDHIGGNDRLKALGVKFLCETEALEKGVFEFGPFRIKAVDLSGHMSPSTGYLIDGFEKQLFVVGDALFAGSMGKCKSTEAFELAFSTLGQAFEKMEPGCLILPGHGPATTLEQELRFNPFLERFR